MKNRNVFATLAICVLSALSVLDVLNLYKVEAQPIRDCRKLVTGTYLSTLSADFGPFLGITTFTQDGNFISNASIQSGDPSIPPFSNTQGSWKCTSDREITATGLAFNYPTATLPGSIIRTDLHATFDPEAGIVQATATLRLFALNANPLKDDSPVAQKIPFTAQRIMPSAPTSPGL